PALLRSSFEQGLFTAVISEPMLEEIADVLSRPRFRNKYGVTATDIRELLLLIEERAEYVLVSGDVNICRDKEDDLILETAVKSRVQYLVTRDDDIKADPNIEKFLSRFDITILSVSKFLKIIAT
ncbi:MAG TPA: putative toxin-antitoxin system toxin component, PIN family, partial [Deltaproteobacteria bacterium]|nr:putative toxin-antitoxin system toxin component, PIN family [Deltaproteobacteria bacterium]